MENRLKLKGYKDKWFKETTIDLDRGSTDSGLIKFLEWDLLEGETKVYESLEIDYKQQRYRSKQCGQACLAMILDISIDEAIKLLNNKKKSTSLYDDLAVALERHDFEVGKSTGEVDWDEVPDNSIIRVVFPTKAGHFIIKHRGKYYDPAIGIVEGYNDYRKITHYITFKKKL